MNIPYENLAFIVYVLGGVMAMSALDDEDSDMPLGLAVLCVVFWFLWLLYVAAVLFWGVALMLWARWKDGD